MVGLVSLGPPYRSTTPYGVLPKDRAQAMNEKETIDRGSPEGAELRREAEQRLRRQARRAGRGHGRGRRSRPAPRVAGPPDRTGNAERGTAAGPGRGPGGLGEVLRTVRFRPGGLFPVGPRGADPGSQPGRGRPAGPEPEGRRSRSGSGNSWPWKTAPRLPISANRCWPPTPNRPARSSSSATGSP